jgi:hypothetical protein
VTDPFPPPVDPSGLPGPDHPALTEFLRRQVDMQFADLRLLLRLPVPELAPNVGCNFTAASMMMSVISGFSVWFFHTEEVTEIEKVEEKSRRQSGWRFKGFVQEYWPQGASELSATEVAALLYEVRNSLAHDLGVSDDPEQKDPREIRLAKHALSLDDVIGLERAVGYPFSVPVIEVEGPVHTLHLTGVYWALHRMLHCALADKAAEIETAVATLIAPEITEVADD